MTPSDYSSCHYHFLPSPNSFFVTSYYQLPASSYSCPPLIFIPLVILTEKKKWNWNCAQTENMHEVGTKDLSLLCKVFISCLLWHQVVWMWRITFPGGMHVTVTGSVTELQYADRKSKRQIRFKMKAYKKEHKLMIRSKEYVEGKEWECDI